MEKLILYHGSSEIVRKPLYGTGRMHNDYGQGFYCTESLELAKEWACTENSNGYANEYELITDNLKILNLSDEKYNILHWLALLLDNRIIKVTTPIMKNSIEWLINNYYINVSEYDVIIGYRADDSYFAFARAFINNQISLKQLSYAMHLGKLGEQVVIKSEKAFDCIRFVDCFEADNLEYYIKRKKRDDDARIAFLKEMENEDKEGIYMRDILRGEVSIDACL